MHGGGGQSYLECLAQPLIVSQPPPPPFPYFTRLHKRVFFYTLF